MMKFGEINEFFIDHKTIIQQMEQFDFFGKRIKSIIDPEYCLDYLIGVSRSQNECYLEYGLVFVVFEDGDVFEITGWEDSKREGFLVSMNHFINDEKYKYCKPDLLTDTILGTYCYGKTIKGFKFKNGRDNADCDCPHYIGIEFEDSTCLWFEQVWDTTNLYLKDKNGKIMHGNFDRMKLAEEAGYRNPWE